MSTPLPPEGSPLTPSQEFIKIKAENSSRIFQIRKEAAYLSQFIKNFDTDTKPDPNEEATTIPLISEEAMAKCVEYMEYHLDNPDTIDHKSCEAFSAWDKKFCEMEQTELFQVLHAANFLDIPTLLDVLCKTVANMIKGKTPEEIRQSFNIENDFSPEEEAQIRKENEWADEK